MKRTINLIVWGGIFVLCCASCKKNTDSSVPPPTTSGEKVMVSLQPTGEFSVSQSTLSDAKQAGIAAAAKVPDTTFYNVEVFNGTTLYAIGRFNRLDSIHFLLDPVTTYNIRMTAVQKGTGYGLFNYSFNYKPLYNAPLRGYIDNKMLYGTAATGDMGFPYRRGAGMISTFPYYYPDEGIGEFPIAEITMYSGTITNYKVDPLNDTLSIALKRMSFGLKFTCPQLTQGKLIASIYSWGPGPNKEFYPYTIDSSLSIYSCLDYQLSDTLSNYDYVAGTRIKLIWALPDGRRFTILKNNKDSLVSLPAPTRNRVLNVNVTLPSLDSSNNVGNNTLGFKLTETPFTVNTPIRF